MLTQYRSGTHEANASPNVKKAKRKDPTQTTVAIMTKTAFAAPLSPASALVKAKFSPEVEKAFLDLQNSKLKNAGFYAVQPKFGIKRLKCRHCFYRSNWKTDMIRHVRIRHNLTEPDHNKGNSPWTQNLSCFSLEYIRFLLDRHDHNDGRRGSIDDRNLWEHVWQRTSPTNISNMERLGEGWTRIYTEGWVVGLSGEILQSLRFCSSDRRHFRRISTMLKWKSARNLRNREANRPPTAIPKRCRRTIRSSDPQSFRLNRTSKFISRASILRHHG